MNEISLQQRLSVAKGGATAGNSVYSFTVDMAGTNLHHTMQEINGDIEDTDNALDLGDVSTAADYWLLVVNLDDTYDVLLSLDAADPLTKQFALIPPGKAAGPLLVPAGATVYAFNSGGDTDLSDIEIVACEV